MDRPNEQTLNERCPYFLVTVNSAGNITQITQLKKDGQDLMNGKPYESNEINVTAGNIYYLFGGWNSDDVFYNSSYYGRYPDPNSTIQNNSSYNNIEFKPFTHETTKACGVAELLWVEFKAVDHEMGLFEALEWLQLHAPNSEFAMAMMAQSGFLQNHLGRS